jgi:CHASE3 domain sensor protein
MKTVRKLALQIGAPVLLAAIVCNAYLAVRHLGQMQRIAALTVESSMIQANISDVLNRLIDMETGERGYLLTGDSSYLQPYTDAKSTIATDFAALRPGLAHRTEHERSLELQLESLANSKAGEMERSISLRQQGYRRRAFKVVDSGEGKEYMDKARAVLFSLLADEDIISARLSRERSATLSKARATIIATNLGLLVITACLLALARLHGQALEKEGARSRQELTLRDLQLQKLTSTLSNQARFKTSAIEANACLLLQEYGGFLPRVGHECAEQIKEAAAQMERLRQDLVGDLDRNLDEQPAYEPVA